MNGRRRSFADNSYENRELASQAWYLFYILHTNRKRERERALE